MGETGLSVGSGDAEQRHSVPQQHVPPATHKPFVRDPLQHPLVCCFEQQLAFLIVVQHDLSIVREQHSADAAWPAVPALLQPQLAAGSDCTTSIKTAIQALTCATIGLDARGSMTVRSSMTQENTKLSSVG